MVGAIWYSVSMVPLFTQEPAVVIVLAVRPSISPELSQSTPVSVRLPPGRLHVIVPRLVNVELLWPIVPRSTNSDVPWPMVRVNPPLE